MYPFHAKRSMESLLYAVGFLSLYHKRCVMGRAREDNFLHAEGDDPSHESGKHCREEVAFMGVSGYNGRVSEADFLAAIAQNNDSNKGYKKCLQQRQPAAE